MLTGVGNQEAESDDSLRCIHLFLSIQPRTREQWADSAGIMVDLPTSVKYL